MTKEEYLCCYGNVRDAMKNICLSCQENERCKGCDVFGDLHKLRKIIHEHFELVEKVEWLKEEMTEQAFDFVFSTQDFLHSWYRGIQITGAENNTLQRKLSEYENPQPYKFEDLKPNMWVWDDVEKKCNKIIEILENKGISFYYITENISRYIVKFEENRFYPLTKALCEVNER